MYVFFFFLRIDAEFTLSSLLSYSSSIKKSHSLYQPQRLNSSFPKYGGPQPYRLESTERINWGCWSCAAGHWRGAFGEEATMMGSCGTWTWSPMLQGTIRLQWYKPIRRWKTKDRFLPLLPQLLLAYTTAMVDLKLPVSSPTISSPSFAVRGPWILKHIHLFFYPCVADRMLLLIVSLDENQDQTASAFRKQ